MGNIIQDVIPFGGMNTDDDSHLFPDGDYRYAENIRNATSEEGNIGAFENILGNLKIHVGDLWNVRLLETSIIVPSGTIHTCIGSCVDITTNCVYYAVHTNQFTVSGVDYIGDSIFEYNKDTNTISTVLRDIHDVLAETSFSFEKYLNFSLLHPMNGMFVVDGMLFFNDGYNPPRKINIAKAKNFTKSVNQRLAFTDNIYAGGNVGFIVTQTVYNSITIGDRVQIFQNRGATYSYYDGTTIVTDKIIDGTNYVIIIEKTFLGDTTVQGGSIYKSYGGYSIPFKEVFMDRIKYPPVYAPIPKYGNDDNYNFNNVLSLQFQFAYKYIYDDKEESTLSPVSKIDKYYTTLSSSVFISGDANVNNVINVSINTGENNVKGIKIYTRSTSETNGDNPVTVNCNNTDWWLVDELTKYDDLNALIIDDNIDYVYSFYNSQNKQFGDQTDLNRPFDYVPQICATSEIIENSRIVDGDITEGYDNVNLDVSVDFVPIQIVDNFSNVYESEDYYTTYNHDFAVYRVYGKYLTLPPVTEITEGQILVFQVLPLANSNYTQESVNILMTPDMIANYPMSVKTIIFDLFKTRTYYKAGTNIWGVGEHQHSTLYTDMLIDNGNIDDILRYNKVYGYDFIETPTFGSVEWSLKNNIIKNRDKWVSRVSDLTLEQLWLSEEDSDYFYNETVRDFILNSLTDYSPSYNDHQIVFIQRARNLWDNTTQVPVSVLGWLLDKVDFKILGGAEMIKSYKSLKTNDFHEFGIAYSDRAGRTSFCNKIKTDVKYLKSYKDQGLSNNLYYFNPKFTINHIPPTWATNYEFLYNPYGANEYYLQHYTKGITKDGSTSKIDILTEITTINNLYKQTIIEPYIWQRGDRIMIVTQKDGKTLLTTKQDFEIVKADATYVWVQGDLTAVPGISGITPTIGEGWLYEIYRPAKTNKETVYYSVGEKYPIIGGYHKGLEQNQTSYMPAIITVEVGNCYMKHGYYLTVNGYREDINAYDFFKSDGIDIGRPNIANVNAKQQNLFNHIRFSGKLFQNTQINNLSRNDASDYIQVSSKFGAITKLVEIGYVLKVLQEKNLNSVYLSRTQLTNTDGSTNLSAVNTPLGTINPSESLYGSKYPRSVIRNNRSLYFLDTMQGAFIKDDNNGSEQISETRKMNRFFTDLCRKIESGLYTVVMTGSYDIRHEEAIFNVSLTLIASPYTVTYYTVAYSEIKNKFTTFYTYNTEQLEDIGQQLISFKNGELYLHNKTTNYNEFYGVDYPQKITIVGNKNPKFNKIFTNTAIRTNSEWNVPEMRILPTLNYPIGMKSRLKKNKFVNKEGVQYASFMNDMTDPRYATPTEALINGRPLRGECVEIDYQNESTHRCVTLMFTIGMTNSELGV